MTCSPHGVCLAGREEGDVDVRMRRHLAAAVAADGDQGQALGGRRVGAGIHVGDDVVVHHPDQLVHQERMAIDALVAGARLLGEPASQLGAAAFERAPEQFDDLRPRLPRAVLRDRRGDGLGERPAVDHRALIGDSRGTHVCGNRRIPQSCNNSPLPFRERLGEGSAASAAAGAADPSPSAPAALLPLPQGERGRREHAELPPFHRAARCAKASAAEQKDCKRRMLDLLSAAAHQPIYWANLGLRPGIPIGHFFTLRFYSLAYLAGILLGYWHLSKMIKAPGAPMAQRHVDDLFFYCTLGVIVGGRLGYALFYTGGQTGKPSLFTHFTPGTFPSWDLLRLWDGGMSFHGGLIGTVLAIAWVSWRGGLSFIRVCDYIAVNVPFGMMFGRIANFINGELWGRAVSGHVPWGMIFCDLPPQPGMPCVSSGIVRHPSQLYEALLEGALMIAIMLPLFWKTRARFRVGLMIGRVHRRHHDRAVHRRVLPRARLPARAVRARYRAQHGAVAVAAVDPARPVLRRPRADAGAAGERREGGRSAVRAGGDRSQARRGMSAGRDPATGSGRSLSEIFRRLIASTGPISLAHYMAEANARYYGDADPLGAGGDFVTAPEISQMFGELIGLWLADMWIRAGRQEPVYYVELGPGRGTLARDALRAMKRYGLEPQVHFVEGSTALKQLQLERCRKRNSTPTWPTCRSKARSCWSPTSSSTRCRCAS